MTYPPDPHQHPYGPPASGPPMTGQPLSGQPLSGPPMSGPPVSGLPVSPGYAHYPVNPAYPAYPQAQAPMSPMPPAYPVVPVAPVLLVQQAPASGMATASLVFSILGLLSGCCSFGVFSLAAVICGHIAMSETRNGARSGRGLAQAGLIMGYIVVVPAIVVSIMMVFGSGMTALTGATSP